MALSCHMTVVLLCQEMRDACSESSESMSSPRSLVSDCLEERRRCSDAKFPSFIKRPGLQAGDSFEHFCAFSEMRVFLHFVCVPLCLLCFVQKEALPQFESGTATVGRMFF